MGEDYYKKVFSKNLRYYMEINHKTQIDIIKDLGINKSSISTWCNGTRLPRMDKVDLLAKYLGVKRSDLIEERNSSDEAVMQMQRILRPDESDLLDNYNTLNTTGKHKAQEYVSDLTENRKYTDVSPTPLLYAAHERTDIEVTDEMRKHDDDIMNDPDF